MMDLLKDFVEQIRSWPISLALVVALAFTGIALKRTRAFDNRFIPAMLISLGTILYVLVGERGSINPHVQYPNVALGLYGCILGTIAWVTQGLLWKYLLQRIPGVNNGDTQFLTKDDEKDEKNEKDKK